MPILRMAAPVLASTNLDRTLSFFVDNFAFVIHHHDAEYAVAGRDEIILHFFRCDDQTLAENTGCYVYVKDVETLYKECYRRQIVHPNGHLETKPWGVREFTVLGVDGNLLRFGEVQ